MTSRPSLVWFRNDLRLADNPALSAAATRGAPTLCLYILDEGGDRRSPGGASRWWLHHSLSALASALAAKGGALWLMRGDPADLLPRLVRDCDVGAVYWNRRYGAAERALDASLKDQMKSVGVEAASFNASLLREPFEVKSQAGQPMKVFTPFWRAAQALGPFAEPAPAPARIAAPPPAPCGVCSLADFNLLPTTPDWAGGLRESWTPGEAGAAAALGAFLAGPLNGYAEDRNRPDFPSTSRLSPHLAFGEIGPRQIVQAANLAVESGASRASTRDLAKFIAEIGWREFSYHLLFHNPDLASRNFQPRFDAMPWRDDSVALTAWRKGQTGYPIVDAGMRQLWRTGWMHNRVRMIVASFLIKHLMIDWRAGEDWFWDTLVDADPASNAASWQWVAGSGADAAPYYRIFNPMLQGAKFDPAGDYVREFVPELAALPADHIHAPWEAPPAVLAKAGVRLGETYPRPLVDHDAARARALAAFQALKSEAS